MGTVKNRCVIVCASPTSDIDFILSQIRKDDFVMCADGGADKLSGTGIVPDMIIGDLDSSKKYTEFKDTEIGGKISRGACHCDVIDRLVDRHRLIEEIRDIHHITIFIEQVDVLVVIDDDELFGILAPCYMADVAVTERVHLVVCLHALIRSVVREQSF